ncbi:MAG: Ig-like domain-containing protein, partial [Bacteroidota bacterium]
DDGTPTATDVATVYISIDPNGGGNDILAIDDINDTFINLPVSGDVSTNDINGDGPAGTEVFTLVSGPTAGGTLVFNPDGTYTYTPPVDFVGEDTFIYQICDGGNPIACDMATVTIEVVDDPIQGNDPPVANNDTNVTLVDTPIDGNVLPNDFDPDGDPITITTPTVTTVEGVTVTINPDGSYTYTPPAGFVGEDTFVYTICDNGTPALCDDATVIIYVLPNNGNITTANDDAYYGEIDTPLTGNVLDNDTDPEGDNQTVDTTISPLSGPSNGTLVINADGTFTYTPGAGFEGTDQFVYGIFDDGSPVATDVATVYILIAQTPAPAIALVKMGMFVDDNQDGCADPGEHIDYTFTVTNEGNVPLSDVVITDPLFEAPNPVVPILFDSGDDNGNGLLDVDETWIFKASYAITQEDIDQGFVENQAVVTAIDPDGTVVTDISGWFVWNDDITIVELCQEPIIAIVKTGVFDDGNGNQCADPGETIDYTFTVTNEGNVTLANISVTDPLLEAPNPIVPIVFVSGDTDGDDQLDVDETWVYTATYTITQIDIDAGQVTNQATAEGTLLSNGTIVTDLSDDEVVTEDDPTVTTLCQNPAIALLKVGTFIDDNGNQCADPGESIEYEFTVVNVGNVTLSDITVTDPLVTVTGGPIVLAPGASDNTSFAATYIITQADIDAGQVTNQATAEGTAPDGSMVSDLSDESVLTEDDPTVTTLCQNPAIALLKVGTFIDDNG